MAAQAAGLINVQIAGEIQEVAATCTGLDLWGKDRSVVAMRVAGEPWDLARTLPRAPR